MGRAAGRNVIPIPDSQRMRYIHPMVKELIQAAKMDHAVTAQKFLDFEGEDWLVEGRDR